MERTTTKVRQPAPRRERNAAAARPAARSRRASAGSC